VTWSGDTLADVVELFADAQRFGDHFRRRPRQRIEHRVWLREYRAKERRRERLRLMRRLRSIDYRDHLARKRAEYDAARGTPKHDKMLATARSRSSQRYAALSQTERSARAKRESERRQAKRAESIGAARCRCCGKPVRVAIKGPAPKFCSKTCQSRDYRSRKRIAYGGGPDAAG
jgi:hypothetical protein